GSLDHFLVSVPASVTAGVAFDVTVTAKDSNSNTVTSYTSTIHFTSGDTLAVLPANYQFTAGELGTHTFSSAVTLKTSSTQTISINATVTSTKTGIASMSVGAAGASTLAVSGYPSTTAGDSHTFTVTAKDSFGNTATGYRGTVHFTSTD